MSTRKTRLFYTACWLVFGGLIISRIWVAEDAYITFRSVENLYAGLGLVFNPGERVEASTHPLWMMGLIIIKGLGLPLHAGSILLGLTCSALGFYFILHDGIDKARERGRSLFIPFSALLLCSVSGFRDFATAGMEYGLVFVLCVLLMQSLARTPVSERPLYHALLLGLLYLTRPELGLLAAYYSIFFMMELLFEDKGWTLRLDRHYLKGVAYKCWLWFLGLVGTAGMYHLFRWLYYEDIFPNTYYAKSGLSSYYVQGLKYLSLNLLWSPAILLALALLAVVLLWPGLRRSLSLRFIKTNARDLAVVGLLIFYVVRLGGDFMAFRFLLPEFILLVLIAARFIDPLIDYLQKNNWMLADPAPQLFSRLGYAALIVTIAFSFWPVPNSKGYIADERTYFTQHIHSSFSLLSGGEKYRWSKDGRRLGELAHCLDQDQLIISNSMTQAHCMAGVGLGYFGVAAGPRIYIIDEQGLPDPEVATSPVLFRWRPGHEHYMDLADVVRRGAVFCNTGEPAYDAVMQTPYGVLIDFSPDILATLPDIEERLQKLEGLKARGSLLIPDLEARSGQDIGKLRKQVRLWSSDAYLQSRQQCWQVDRKDRLKTD